MERHELIQWLMKNGGAIVRYRTAAELLDDPSGVDLDRLSKQLLESPQVRLWLGRLKDVVKFHDSGNDRLENVMGKLLEFGLRAGMLPLDKGVARFRKWMASGMDRPRGIMRMLNGAIAASSLVRAGYDDDPLCRLLSWRLDALCSFVRTNGYDLYANPKRYPDIPKAFRGRALVKPELTPDGEYTLPCIHDFYAFSAFPTPMADTATRRKVNQLVKYVLDDAYQALPEGYGILRAGKRRYYAMGWSVHLPGFHGFGLDDHHAGQLVQRVELMGHFPTARKHRWFKGCMEHLENFRTDDGTWRLPRRYLKEQKVGYWVGGAHMGLEENRRSSRATEIESTFRMLKIRRATGK